MHVWYSWDSCNSSHLAILVCSALGSWAAPLLSIWVQAFMPVHYLPSCPPSSQFCSRPISSWYYMSIHLHKLRRRRLVSNKTSVTEYRLLWGVFHVHMGNLSDRDYILIWLLATPTFSLQEWSEAGQTLWVRPATQVSTIKAQEEFLPEMSKSRM